MFSRRNLQGLRLHAAQSIEYDQALLRGTVQGRVNIQLVIDPDKKRGIFELMLHRQIESGKRHYDLARGVRRRSVTLARALRAGLRR